jgi:hypothetical protein
MMMTGKLTVPVLCRVLLAGCATSPTGRTQFLVVSKQSAIASSKQA